MKGIPDIVAVDPPVSRRWERTPAVEPPRHRMRLLDPTNRAPNDWMRAERELVRHYA
jgi:hypothetical protein